MLHIILVIESLILIVVCVMPSDDLQKSKAMCEYFWGIQTGFTFSILLFSPFISDTVIISALIGITYGTISSTICKKLYKNHSVISCHNIYPPKFFITGDKHRNFDNIEKFCRRMNTRKSDVLIVLGDTGFNYYADERDDKLKKKISSLNITLFCLHGNKENRPQNVGTYGIRSFCGGKVMYEPNYPDIYFAIDGEIYIFEGKKYMVVGGAHSVDKLRCLEEGTPFWHDEMPDNATKTLVEQKLQNEGNKIYGMMTHTCPIRYIPTEMFISTRQNVDINRKKRKTKPKKLFRPDIDRSTEKWLGELEEKLNYEVWFCGHYHIDKQIDKIQMMYNDIRPLHLPSGDEQCPT